MSMTALLAFQSDTMTPAQLAAVSFLARYSGHTHKLYASQLRRWFSWCEPNALDPLVGIQRAHVELYIRNLGDSGLMVSSVNTSMHAVRGLCRYAHIDGIIVADPAGYARLTKVHADESRTQGLDRLELIRFLQVAQTLSVHHGALAFLLGINALRASEAAAVRIEDYAEPLRGHRVLHLVGKGNKPATMPLTVPMLRVLEVCRSERTEGRLILRPLSGTRSTAATPTGWSRGSPRPPAFLGTWTRSHHRCHRHISLDLCRSKGFGSGRQVTVDVLVESACTGTPVARACDPALQHVGALPGLRGARHGRLALVGSGHGVAPVRPRAVRRRPHAVDPQVVTREGHRAVGELFEVRIR